MSTVLVTDAERGSAVSFIRSLARAGHVVIAGDAGRISPGRWSRATTASFRYPDPLVDPDGAADSILEQVVEHDVDVLLPVTDATTRVVESLRDRLPASCRVGTPPAEAASVAADKHRTLELAVELGVPVPATVVVESPAAARAAADALGWPVVVKPVSSLGRDAEGAIRKFEVGYGLDGDDLERKVRVLGAGAPVLLQEHCAGDGVGVEVLADQGRILRCFSHRRLHEVPVTGGASALRESIAVDPELLDYTTRLMSELKWTGLAMVEFKAGPSGHRLMEINGRPWGSLPLAVRAGVDFPADYVRLLLGGELDGHGADVPSSYSVGTVARNLYLEVLWIASVLRGPTDDSVHVWPPRRAALMAILRLFSPRVDDDILSVRDPLASIAELMSVAVKVAGKARSR
jgi:predicted ATP-grasp superfamily ATP-dependent carboligase